MNSTDTPLTTEQSQALDAARELVRAGVPVFLAPACPPDCPRPGHDGQGWHYPRAWEATPSGDTAAIDMWRPGDALAAVCGHTLDVLDVDPRHGGDVTAAALREAGLIPHVYAAASTPSGGAHWFVASLGCSKDNSGRLGQGVDYQGGCPDGTGRGFVFIAPTVRPSQVDGVSRPYVWLRRPDAELVRAEAAGDDTGHALADMLRRERPARAVGRASVTPARFATAARRYTMAEAEAYVWPRVEAFAAQGYDQANYNARLNDLAVMLGHFVPAFLPRAAAEVALYDAAVACGCVAAPPGHRYRAMGERGVRATIASGLDRGQAEPYVLDTPDGPGKGDDPPDVPAGDAVDALLAEMLSVEELLTMPNPRPLVAGLLDLDTASWLIGKPGSYKSFVALDLAAHVGVGKPWHGHDVTQGEVVYIVAEGVGGTRLRVAAWQRVHGPMSGVRFLPRPVQAGDANAWAVLVEACRRVGPALVIIDTQARVTVGMDENDNTEMGGYIERADEIKRATGACVLTVHHIGRNGTDARGASAIDGAQDAELRIERTADRRVTIHMDKAKDADDAVKVELELLKVDGGVDPETLRDLSSLVVVPVGTLPLIISRPWLDELVPNQAAIVGVLADHAPHAGATKPEVRALLAERYPMVRTSFNTAWDALLGKGIISRVGASQRWVLTSMVPVEPDLSSQHVGLTE